MGLISLYLSFNQYQVQVPIKVFVAMCLIVMTTSYQ